MWVPEYVTQRPLSNCWAHEASICNSTRGFHWNRSLIVGQSCNVLQRSKTLKLRSIASTARVVVFFTYRYVYIILAMHPTNYPGGRENPIESILILFDVHWLCCFWASLLGFLAQRSWVGRTSRWLRPWRRPCAPNRWHVFDAPWFWNVWVLVGINWCLQMCVMCSFLSESVGTCPPSVNRKTI